MWQLVVASAFFAAVCSDNVGNILAGSAFTWTNIQQTQSKCGNFSLIDPTTLFQMIYAGGKQQSGILTGNIYSLGTFDECYNIKSETVAGVMYGKYCLGWMSPPTSYRKEIPKSRKRNIYLHPEPKVEPQAVGLLNYYGVCFPSWCTAEEVSGTLTFSDDYCSSQDTAPQLTGGAITTIVILSIIFSIAIASTMFDIYLHYSNKKTPHELFLAFSFLTNGRKLLSVSSNSEQLLCLNGIRAISMMWVIIGHVYNTSFSALVSNVFDLFMFASYTENMFIEGATLAVDSFLTIGGFVIVYTYLKARDRGVKFNIFLFYFHRYLRLTPALAIMVLVHANLVPYLGTGPIWKLTNLYVVDNCNNTWWSVLLYIANYLQDGYCVPQSWYLQVDMQLYILSPIILICLSRIRKIALGMLGIAAVGGVISPLIIGYVHKLNYFDLQNPAMSTYYYTQTYARFGPYVIGMILGYVVYELKRNKFQLKMHPILCSLLWITSMAGLLSCLYAGHNLLVAENYDRWAHALFLGFNRPAWSVALCVVIFLCAFGYGGPVNAFLSASIFQFLAKISYSMYLVHVIVIFVRYFSAKEVFKFSHITMMHMFWGDFMFTVPFSVLLCLTFESPIVILEKYLFRRNGSSSK